jgi:large subunit ribosomal protein L25
MGENATLKAAARTETGKGAMRRLRREGRIPAVVYGRGEETRPLSLDARDLETLIKHHSLDTTIIELTIEGAGRKGKLRTLVAEVQSHPYKPQILHVDFQQIHAGERVTIQVPVRLTGTPAGVRAGGVLQQVLHDVEVECAVEEIPAGFDVDVEALEIGDSVHVSELVMPENVSLLIDLERTICSVAPPTVLEVPEEVEAEAEPELVGVEEEEEEAVEAAVEEPEAEGTEDE